MGRMWSLGSGSSARSWVLRLTVGAFGVSAALGLIALLAPASFGRTQQRMVGTTLLVGVACVAILCYFATAATRYRVLGIAGGAIVLVPFVIGLAAIWGASIGTVVGRVAGVTTTLAIGFALVCLLLGLSIHRRSPRRVLWPTLALSAALAVVISILIGAGAAPDDLGGRLLAAAAILVALGTLILVVAALSSPRRSVADTGAPLVAIQIPMDLARRFTPPPRGRDGRWARS